jgi:hypothetical protein
VSSLPAIAYALLARAAGRLLGSAVKLGVRLNQLPRRIVMPSQASEALAPQSLPEMIKNLGLAVAVANKDLRAATPDEPFMMTINRATIDLKVAISVQEATTQQAALGLSLKAFSINASYARTYSFKEEASSQITVELAVTPRTAVAAPQT